METKNEISSFGVLSAGILLIFFLSVPILLICSLWPDKIPDNNNSAIYSLRFFRVQLLGPSNTKTDTLNQFTEIKTSTNDSSNNTARLPNATTNTAGNNLIIGGKRNKGSVAFSDEKTINLSTLILILVSCGGFLGNMVHIASSFISFVGANQFKKSWILWYFVKPFTAAGLAVALYFSIRAGFFSNSSATINIYGVMTAAILTGLFTDSATLKLKEVFETIFKPKDNRPDKL